MANYAAGNYQQQVAQQQLAQTLPTGMASAGRDMLMNAMGGESYGSEIASMLGPIPNMPGNVNGYAARNINTYAYPDNFIDKNLTFMTNTLDDTKNMLPGYIRDIFPVYPTDQINTRVVKMTFDRTLPDIVSEMAPARLLQTGKTETTGTTERHSIAFIIEQDFAKTEQGNAVLLTHMAQTAYCVQMGEDAERFRTIFASPFDSQYAPAVWNADRRPATELNNIFGGQNELVDMLKRPNGLPTIDEYVTIIMEPSVQPDTILIPPQTASIITLSTKTNTQYQYTGVANPFNDRLKKEAIADYNGKNVYVVPTYNLEAQGKEVNLATRKRQFGSFAGMTYFNYKKKAPYNTVLSTTTQIQDFSLSRGGYQNVTLQEALQHAALFENGDLSSRLKMFLAGLNNNTVRAPRNGLVHPFIKHSDTQEGKFEFAPFIGDIELPYLTEEHTRNIAESCTTFQDGITNKLSGTVQSDTNSILTSGKRLMTTLNNPNLTDINAMGFIATAISQLPDPANLSSIVNSNMFGGIPLPIWQVDPGNAARYQSDKDDNRPYILKNQVMIPSHKNVFRAIAEYVPFLYPRADQQRIDNLKAGLRAVDIAVPNGAVLNGAALIRNIDTADVQAAAANLVPANLVNMRRDTLTDFIRDNYTSADQTWFFPVMPYLYGNLPGFKTMAALKNQGGLPAYYAPNTDAFEKADEFVKLSNIIVAHASKQFPGNASLDEKFCPYYMRPNGAFSGLSGQAAMCTFTHSLLAPFTFPVFAKIGGVQDWAQNLALTNIAQSLGVPNGVALMAKLYKVLNGTELGQKYFTNPDTINRFIRDFDARAGRGKLLEAFADNIVDDPNAQNPSFNGRELEIYNLVFNMMRYADGAIGTPSGDYRGSQTLDAWRNTNINVLSDGINLQQNSPYNVPSNRTFVNVRLTIDSNSIKDLTSGISSLPTDPEKIAYLNNLFLRPANPAIPTIPLDNGDDANATIESRLDALDLVGDAMNNTRLEETPLGVNPQYAQNARYGMRGNNNNQIRFDRFRQQNNLRTRFNNIALSALQPFTIMLMSLYLLQPINYTTVQAFMINNIPLWFDLLLVRPFQTYVMGSLVFLQKPLGYLLEGQKSFILSNNGTEGTFTGKYNIRWGTALLHPERLLLVPDAVSCKYLGGFSRKFIDPTALDMNTIDLENAYKHGSILSMVVPFRSTAQDAGHKSLNVGDDFDLTGHYRPEVYSAFLDPSHNVDYQNEGTFPTAEYYNYVYHFREQEFSSPFNFSSLQSSFFTGFNTRMCRESQMMPNPDGSFTDAFKTSNTTEFGAYNREDMKRVRQTPFLGFVEDNVLQDDTRIWKD